jgi:hypothetical protein
VLDAQGAVGPQQHPRAVGEAQRGRRLRPGTHLVAGGQRLTAHQPLCRGARAQQIDFALGVQHLGHQRLLAQQRQRNLQRAARRQPARVGDAVDALQFAPVGAGDQEAVANAEQRVAALHAVGPELVLRRSGLHGKRQCDGARGPPQHERRRRTARKDAST